MRLNCKLINGEELEFEISKQSFVVGRSTQADVVIPHEGMSRRHCLIESKNGQLYITDLESSNGVFIDDKRIDPNVETPLPIYLNLSFGPVQSLRIEQEENLTYKIEPKTSTNIHTHKTNSEIKRPVKAARPESIKKKAKEPSKKNLLLLVGAILSLAVLGYLYYEEKRLEETPLSPEEIYE